ncbi:hypothetical protein C8J56DRAFT_895416 [Mycena floridula]|nr:hypothetical protein C8J56DRAFT_895416 [Mycena floridula]
MTGEIRNPSSSYNRTECSSITAAIGVGVDRTFSEMQSVSGLTDGNIITNIIVCDSAYKLVTFSNFTALFVSEVCRGEGGDSRSRDKISSLGSSRRHSSAVQMVSSDAFQDLQDEKYRRKQLVNGPIHPLHYKLPPLGPKPAGRDDLTLVPYTMYCKNEEKDLNIQEIQFLKKLNEQLPGIRFPARAKSHELNPAFKKIQPLSWLTMNIPDRHDAPKPIREDDDRIVILTPGITSEETVFACLAAVRDEDVRRGMVEKRAGAEIQQSRSSNNDKVSAVMRMLYNHYGSPLMVSSWLWAQWETTQALCQK